MLQSIFSLVLTQSIAGGFLALMVISLKPITDKKFNALWQYYIWIIVVMWLLLPLVPDISTFSNHMTPMTQIDNLLSSTIPSANEPLSSVNYMSFRLAAIPIHIQTQKLIPWFWLTGVILFAIYHGYRYTLFNLKFKRSSFLLTNPVIADILDSCKSDMGIKRNISLYGSSSIGTPILSGIFKPVITMPDVNFKPDEYRLIFTHELIHYKQRDIWYKMLALAVNAIHWFNPLAYIAVKNINEACEYACDEVVVYDMNDNERRYYGETILNLITLQTDKKMAMSTALCGIKKIERRLNMIMKSKRPKKSIVIIAVVVALALTSVGVVASGFTGKVLGVTKSGNDFSTQNKSEMSEMKKMYDFHLELDNTMAKALEIELNNYRKIDTLVGFMKPEYRELNIGDVREQIPLKYGDTTPSIYINKDNTQGIALTQDLQGVYTLYEFEANKDKESRFKWTITGTKSVQGEYKAVNENVKKYFEKNPNPKNEKLPPLQTPTSEYETIKPQN